MKIAEFKRLLKDMPKKQIMLIGKSKWVKD